MPSASYSWFTGVNSFILSTRHSPYTGATKCFLLVEALQQHQCCKILTFSNWLQLHYYRTGVCLLVRQLLAIAAVSMAVPRTGAENCCPLLLYLRIQSSLWNERQYLYFSKAVYTLNMTIPIIQDLWYFGVQWLACLTRNQTVRVWVWTKTISLVG